MKKLTALLLCLAMVLIMLSGCNVKTKDDVKGPDTSSNGNSEATAGIPSVIPFPSRSFLSALWRRRPTSSVTS